MVNVEIHSEILNQRLGQLSDALNGRGQMGDAAQLVANEARLFCKMVIRLTAPKTKQQGESAVERDLNKIFTPVNDDLLTMVGSAHGLSAVDAWMTTAGGEKQHLQWDRIDPSGSGMKDWHEANRNGRGRTPKLKRKGSSWYSPYVVSFEDFQRYLAKIQSRVGRKKAAWAVAFKKLGGKVPQWIGRHSGDAKGTINDAGLKTRNHPSLSLSSFAPGVMDDQRTVADAMRISARSIKKKAELILAGYAYDWKSGRVIAPKEQALMLDAA